MECKSGNTCQFSFSVRSFNLISMECKCYTSHLIICIDITFNLISMECKCKTGLWQVEKINF